ncbi:MAG: hypothetical protein KJ990_06640 [Proteobacteria bacterium]|nr:hypothetical protein [Pseudomonadota bacterium]MBU1648953.1 hypothetical protein [Pseudomonadota bacterium]
MIRSAFCLLLLLNLLLPGHLSATTRKMITLTVPDSVLSQALDKSLPISVDTESSTLSGAITIVKISNLQIHDQGIACRIALQGNDMHLNTEIGGHVIKLKVGSLQLDLQCNAVLRFDPARQMLYVKPVISDLQASSTTAQGDIDALLLAFLNNREFPVKMKQMEPLIAETSGKTININMNIVGIRTQHGVLQFDILPQIQSTSHSTKKKQKGS